MQKDLILLSESLDDIYTKYYQNSPNSHLDRDEFDDTIRIDPTFRPQKDALGKYGQWLLKLRNTLNHNFSDADSQELTDQLKIFNDHKNGYDVSDRDITKIKSLEDLIELNHKYDAEQSSIQLLKAKEIKGLEIIGQSAHWEVYRPRTYEASKYIRGDNASWCTGRSSSPSYFNSYNKTSILIVFIYKNNRNIKYQGAFNKNSYKCTEFKNARNISEDFVTFYINNSDISTIIKKSQYSQIDVEIQDAITQRKLQIEHVNKLLSKLVDGVLIIDDEVLTLISDSLYTDKPLEGHEFLARGLKTLKITTVKKSISDIHKTLFSANSAGNNVAFLDKLSIYLPEDITDISNDVDLLSKYHKIGISKKSKIICYQWQKEILKPYIQWY